MVLEDITTLNKAETKKLKDLAKILLAVHDMKKYITEQDRSTEKGQVRYRFKMYAPDGSYIAEVDTKVGNFRYLTNELCNFDVHSFEVLSVEPVAAPEIEAYIALRSIKTCSKAPIKTDLQYINTQGKNYEILNFGWNLSDIETKIVDGILILGAKLSGFSTAYAGEWSQSFMLPDEVNAAYLADCRRIDLISCECIDEDGKNIEMEATELTLYQNGKTFPVQLVGNPRNVRV